MSKGKDNVYENYSIMIILIMNRKFNRDGKEFKQYHQSEQLPLTITHYPLAFLLPKIKK
jgi:hypothetical protein